MTKDRALDSQKHLNTLSKVGPQNYKNSPPRNLAYYYPLSNELKLHQICCGSLICQHEMLYGLVFITFGTTKCAFLIGLTMHQISLCVVLISRSYLPHTIRIGFK